VRAETCKNVKDTETCIRNFAELAEFGFRKILLKEVVKENIT
jgi:hypothetical protein